MYVIYCINWSITYGARQHAIFDISVELEAAATLAFEPSGRIRPRRDIGK